MARRPINFRRCQDKLSFDTPKEAEDMQARWIAMGYFVEKNQTYKCPMCSRYHFKRTAAQKAAARG